MFLQEEIIFLRKELDNKQRVIETLPQQISENVRLIHQGESTTFNVINKDVNIKSSKDKFSKYQSPSKLINNNTMEKSALIKEKINIQLNDIRKEARKRFYESKEKKRKKRVPNETQYPTIENVEKVSSIRQWEKGTTLIVGDSMLAGIEQNCISGNRSIKVQIFEH